MMTRMSPLADSIPDPKRPQSKEGLWDDDGSTSMVAYVSSKIMRILSSLSAKCLRMSFDERETQRRLHDPHLPVHIDAPPPKGRV